MYDKILKSIEQRKLLILSVSDCNMQCSYCFINDKINLNKIENFELKDYIKELLLKINYPIIVKFFGGEPLLEKEYFFDLIDSCCSAKKGHFFNIGINGTLLSKEDVDFLLKKNVQLIISSDGNTELNNKHRKFTNKKEAGSVIIEKMHMVKEIAEYHRKSNLIFFSAILLHDTNIRCIFDWFYKNKIQLVFNSPYRVHFSKNELNEFIENYDNFMSSVLLSNDIFYRKAAKSVLLPEAIFFFLNQKWKLPNCLPETLNIDISLGKIYYCSLYGFNESGLIGSVKDGVNEKIIEDMLIMARNNSIKFCCNCNVKEFCNGGCFEKLKFYSNNYKEHDNFYCNFIKRQFYWLFKSLMFFQDETMSQLHEMESQMPGRKDSYINWQKSFYF